MEIRLIGNEDAERYRYIGGQAFAFGSRRSADVSDTERPDTPRVRYGVWDDRDLQAGAEIIPFKAHFGSDVTLKMGGIAAVACLPDSRGRGYAGGLLERCLEHMRADGQVVSALFPFDWDFYARFGWQWAGIRRRYRVPTRILKPGADTARVRMATEEDRPAIVSAYTAFARRYRGMIARDDAHWSSILDDTDTRHTYTYIYPDHGTLEAYCTMRGGEARETGLTEVIALTADGYRALLGLLRRHEMQTKKFAWQAPEDDPLWLIGYHWEIETRARPVTQARVVDAQAAFTAWRPAASARGRFVLAIEDRHAPWNRGNWSVEFEGDAVTVAATDQKPHVSLDIGALSQAYFGRPTLDELRAGGRITTHADGGYAALRDFLAGPVMYMNDSF